MGAWKHSYAYWDETSAAFHSYNADFATRLAVCADGLQVVPCEGPAAGNASSPSSPPVR